MTYVIKGNGIETAITVVGDERDAINCAKTLCADDCGIDEEDVVVSDWNADGWDDDGKQLYRRLVWASEAEAENDPGANAWGEITK